MKKNQSTLPSRLRRSRRRRPSFLAIAALLLANTVVLLGLPVQASNLAEDDSKNEKYALRKVGELMESSSSSSSSIGSNFFIEDEQLLDGHNDMGTQEPPPTDATKSTKEAKQFTRQRILKRKSSKSGKGKGESSESEGSGGKGGKSAKSNGKGKGGKGKGPVETPSPVTPAPVTPAPVTPRPTPMPATDSPIEVFLTPQPARDPIP